jgi:hypothetical protein
MKGTDTKLCTGNYKGSTISTVKLDNNRVFIAHSNSSSYYLNVMVVTIDDTNITAGTDVQLVTSLTNSGYRISAVLLEENKVFIAHSSGTSTATSNYLYGIVCTINGTTITGGSDTKISSESYSGCYLEPVALSNNRVLIFHSYSSSYYLYATYVSISGTSVTRLGGASLATVAKAGSIMSAKVLPNGNVFLAHNLGSEWLLYGMVVKVSSDIPKIVVAETQLSEVIYTCIERIATCLLPNGNILIIHGYGSEHNLYGMIVSISDTAITKGIDTQLSTTINTGSQNSMLLLDNGIIFNAHSYGTYYHLYAQIFGIDYANNIPTNNISITDYETQVRKVTTGQFDGIAKTSGEGGDDTGHKDIVSIWTYKSKMVSGVFPLTLEESEGENLINYKIEGNTDGVGTVSKNLLDLSDYYGKSYTSNGGTITVDNEGGINLSGNPTGYLGFSFTIKEKLKSEGLTTFSMSGEFTNLAFQFTLMDDSSTVLYDYTLASSTRSITINMSDYPTYTKIACYIKRSANNVAMKGTAYIQIEEGDVATEYIPFGKCEIPIRSKYPNVLDLSVASYPVAKNGVTVDYRPSDGKLILNGTSATSTSIPIYIYQDIDSAKTYNVAITTNGYINGFTSCAGYDEKGAAIYDLALSVDKTVEKSKSGFNQIQYIQFWCPAAVTFENCEVDIQIDEGDKYLMPITTNIYLDEPLRKVGNYADYIDFKTKKVVRQVEVVGEMLQGLDTPIEETISLPSIPTLEGTTVLDSNVQPSNIEVEYFKK